MAIKDLNNTPYHDPDDLTDEQGYRHAEKLPVTRRYDEEGVPQEDALFSAHKLA